ncbi:hypothetical protein ACFV27_00640 [Streptomyces antimycoticus]|uniref:hypothetical protein n=1 Tax=Streptomyces antimycoticus TaxID=68175 RepID=UPI0036A4977B
MHQHSRPSPLVVLGALALVALLVVAACAHLQGGDAASDDVGLTAAVAGTSKPRPPARPAAPPRVSKAPAAPHRSVSKAPARVATRTVTAKPGHGSSHSHGHVDLDLDCD